MKSSIDSEDVLIMKTQPALVLRYEAMTEERLGEIRSLMEGVLAEMKKQ